MTEVHEPVPYNGQLTDDDPQIQVVISQSWRQFILGAVERLIDEKAWDELDDQAAATQQALDAMARLLGEEYVPMGEYPPTFWFPINAFDLLASGGMTTSVSSEQMFNFWMRQTTPIDNQDIAEITIPVAAGTWELMWLGVKSANSGYLRWYLDDVIFPDQLIPDLYSPALVYNVNAGAWCTVTTPGLHTFRMCVIGKNAASSNYQIRTTGVVFRKTG